MNYYEILFNSSQTSRDGSVGFGIRSMTEGMPAEYIQPIVNSGIFSQYQSGTFKVVYPSDLLADPAKILTYPVQYSYTTVALNTGRKLYLLRRTIPLGFDYAFYQTGKATRLGNYGVHVLVFEQEPESAIFDLLYEKPAEGCAAFIPRNRVPDMENEELKTLMLGKMPDMPQRNLPMHTLHEAFPCQEAYHVLFYLIEARIQRKPLIIRCVELTKHRLIADLYRLMYAYASQMTFTSGVYSTSIDTSVDLTFLNEYYPATLPTESPAYLYRDAAVQPVTEEYGKYAEDLKRAVETGDSMTAMKLSAWLLSGDYVAVSGASESTSTAFFHLCHKPEAFTGMDLRNEELLRIVAGRIPATSERMEVVRLRLEELLNRAIENPDPRDFVEAICHVRKVGLCGIDVTPVIAAVRSATSRYILESASRMVEIFQCVDKGLFESYTLKSDFIAHVDILRTPEVRPHLMKLYRYFFENVEQSIYELLASFVMKLEAPQLAAILKDANPNPNMRQEAYVRTINQNPTYVKQLWRVAVADLGKSIHVNLFDRFKNYVDSPDFAELYYYALSASGNGDVKELLRKSAFVARCNPAYLQLICQEEHRTRIYHSLFQRYLVMVERKNIRQELAVMKECVIDLLNTKCEINDWIYLYNLLDGYIGEYAREQYRIAWQMRDRTFFVEVAYAYLEKVKNREGIRTIVRDLMVAKVFDESRYTAAVARYPHVKQVDCLGVWLTEAKYTFKDAQLRLEELPFYQGDDVQTLYYGDAYRTYCRNQKMKGFLKNIFGLSKKGKQSDEEEPSGKKSKSMSVRNPKANKNRQ